MSLDGLQQRTSVHSVDTPAPQVVEELEEEVELYSQRLKRFRCCGEGVEGERAGRCYVKNILGSFNVVDDASNCELIAGRRKKNLVCWGTDLSDGEPAAGLALYFASKELALKFKDVLEHAMVLETGPHVLYVCGAPVSDSGAWVARSPVSSLLRRPAR